MTIYREVKNAQGLKSKYMRISLGGTNPSFVLTGFESSKSSSMDVDITAGTAYIKDSNNETYEVTSSATETLTLTGNDVTNYIFLHCDNGSDWLTFSTTATVPDDAILIATVTTVAGDITGVVDSRTTTMESRNKLLVDFKGINYWEGGVSPNWFQQGSPLLILYLNELQTDKIKLLSLKYSWYIKTSEMSEGKITTYYNIGGSDVELDSVYKARGTASGTETVTINQSTASTTAIPYIKFTPMNIGGSSNSWIFRIKEIYLEYEIID
jgi:hypothetical protein